MEKRNRLTNRPSRQELEEADNDDDEEGKGEEDHNDIHFELDEIVPNKEHPYYASQFWKQPEMFSALNVDDLIAAEGMNF